MKTLSTLAFAAAVALFATGCTTHTHTTATTETAEVRTVQNTRATPDQRRVGNVRSYSQEDMQKTGRTDVGSQLEALDPSVYVSGNR